MCVANSTHLRQNLLISDPAERMTKGVENFQAKWFFEGGVVTWVPRHPNGFTVTGNIPEFNSDLADLDVYDSDQPKPTKEEDSLFANF